jgi:hypothetical protein
MWDATTTRQILGTTSYEPRWCSYGRLWSIKAWRVGVHHAGSAAPRSLVQVSDINVYRDITNFKRDDGKLYTGIFAINQHWGYDYPKDDLGRSSAGCLVGRTKRS